MEHRSYMSRTGRSSLLLSLLVSAFVFSPLIQAENVDEYGENIEHEIIILSEHHHQNDAFTQGLEMYNGTLYESTGLYGFSSLREVDPITGGVIRSKLFNDTIFAEGITIYNDTIVMLTWKSQVAYVFEMENLSEVSSYVYEGEGWGICFDGNHFVMSNGTSSISFRNTETFEIERTVSVTDSFGNLISKINELECVNTSAGPRVIANVWQQDIIVVFDPSNGTVLGEYDASHLTSENNHGINNVLNGIAHSTGSEFWITGKNWSKMYLIQMTNLSQAGEDICVSSCNVGQDSISSGRGLMTITVLIVGLLIIFFRRDGRPVGGESVETSNRHDEQPKPTPPIQEDGVILDD